MFITKTKLTFKLGFAIAIVWVSTLFTYSTYRLFESIMCMINH